MPSSLPIPSKGALRTLRNLALGTSCTVSFTTGMLTEDRRRRIHAAREVQDNGKKLKSARNYHSGGGVATAGNFEDEVRRYQEDGFLQTAASAKVSGRDSRGSPSHTRSRHIEERSSGRGRDHAMSNTEHSKEDLTTMPPPFALRRVRPRLHPFKSLKMELSRAEIVQPNVHEQPSADDQAKSGFPTQIGWNCRQTRIASDIMGLLDQGMDPEIVNAAAGRFLDAFAEGSDIGDLGLSGVLMNALVHLSKASLALGDLDTSEKILSTVIGVGPIAEDLYKSFGPFQIIEHLLRKPSDQKNHGPLDSERLQKAVKIFLAKFKEKPEPLKNSQMSLGKDLCIEAYRARMYNDTILVYRRLRAVRRPRNEDMIPVGYYILALYHDGNYKSAIYDYLRLFTETNPGGFNYFHVTKVALDSAIKLEKLDQAEKIIFAAFNLAKKHNHDLSTTWIMKVLAATFQRDKNIKATRALFDRCEPLIQAAHHPKAVYGAIIQYCVQAGEMEAAKGYQALSDTLFGPQNIDDIRICGHFALAKAMKQDWEGVQKDFEKMSVSVNEENMRAYGSNFSQILTAYIKTHSIHEVEEFLQLYTEDFKVPLTPHMSNVMVETYAQNGEFESLQRWLKFACAKSSNLSPVTSNIILQHCRTTWRFSFDEIYRLYKGLESIQDRSGSTLLDDRTISVLRKFAMADFQGQEKMAQKLQLVDRLSGSTRLTPTPVDSADVGRRILEDSAKGNHEKAVQAWNRALARDVHLDSSVVVAATKASLELHGNDLIPTMQLLAAAQRKRHNISLALSTVIVFDITYRSRQGDLSEEDIQSFLKSMASTLRNNEALISGAATHAAHLLVTRGYNQQAIALWTATTSRANFSRSSVDVITLTVLLKAYMGRRDSSGVQWCIETLRMNNLVPDKIFCSWLKTGRKTARDSLKRMPEGRNIRAMEQYHDVLIEAWEVTLKMKKKAREQRAYIQDDLLRLLDGVVTKDIIQALDEPANDISQPDDGFSLSNVLADERLESMEEDALEALDIPLARARAAEG